MATLKDKYFQELAPQMMKTYGYKNVMQVPRLAKIVINRGVGSTQLAASPKALDVALDELALITGQRPIITRAKKSIANFKLRAKTAIGCKVTLRQKRMYDFMEKFINIALPKIRDFKGVSLKSFDKQGNYSMGIKEQTIFPEIDYDKLDKIRGMDVTIVTNAKTDEEAMILLKLMGMPFRDV